MGAFVGSGVAVGNIHSANSSKGTGGTSHNSPPPLFEHWPMSSSKVMQVAPLPQLPEHDNLSEFPGFWQQFEFGVPHDGASLSSHFLLLPQFVHLRPAAIQSAGEEHGTAPSVGAWVGYFVGEAVG